MAQTSANDSTKSPTTSESCGECHKKEYDLWVKSNHALAERLPRPEMDQTAFEPARTFKHGSQTSQTRLHNGEYQIVTMGFRTNVEPYNVERVIGHDPLRQFLTAAPGGRFQVHEASYDPKLNQWFNVYGDDRKTGEWGHWTGRGMNWNSRCAECHNTRLRKNYDEASDTYHTTMAEMSVGCEACHGSLQAHAEWRRANPNSKSQDPTITRLTDIPYMDRIITRLTTTQNAEMCATCHSRQDNLTEAFKPGDSFFDHYSLETLDQADRWYADGQIHDEDYEFTSLLGSRMYQRGVRCLDCHNPHSMKNLASGNALCMRCHTGSYANAPVINPAEHGHHKLTDKGGECIGCHMPVTVYMQRHRRHDHGFTIPDPLLTKQYAIPNACNRCHAEKTADWALDYTEKWYGKKMNRHTRERAQWIAMAQQGEDSSKNQLTGMLATNQESPYWRAVIAGCLWRWTDDPTVKAALLACLKDEHPLVREKAVRSLELSVEAGNSEILAALNPLLEDPSRNVRVATAWILKSTVDLKSRAGRELQTALDLDADQPIGQYRKAMLFLARQQPEKALEHLQRAVAWDEFAPWLRSATAEVLSQLERPKEAAEQLQAACRVEPQSVDYRFKLGLALAQAHNTDKAVEAFSETIKLDPKHAQAWFNLGLTRSLLGQKIEALKALDQAEALAPRDAQIYYAKAVLLTQGKRYEEARNAAARALQLQPTFKAAQDLLQKLP